MKRKTVRNVTIALFAIALLAALLTWLLGGPKSIDGKYTKYDCDVKNMRLSTTIEIKNDGTKVGTIGGNIFTFVTDPLTLNDTAGNKVAYAGDEYHFIAQDSHSIYLNDGFAVEMVGKVKMFGEAYEIYDNNQAKIAKVSFNWIDTAGEMYDADGKLIATYSAYPFMNDYTVKISEDCEMDDDVVLMIMASYYSDQAADGRSSSSNHSSTKKN